MPRFFLQVAHQSLQTLAVGCIAEMHTASKVQVDNTGDGRVRRHAHALQVLRLKEIVNSCDTYTALCHLESVHVF
jgi:hypothetical protein